ncbi:MAG: SUMF1/EgtB/PvdO family nonheme iron enzyme [Terriglobia bacterium]
MKRRKFLKGSAASAGALMAGLVPETLHQGPRERATKSVSSEAANLVEVPGISYEATDPLTTVPVTVTLGRFLISPFETTQREFEEVMGSNPSFHKGAEFPVERVSWWDAIRYCNLRSQMENLEPCYNVESGYCDQRKNGYRLPTEAEWVHAAGDDPASIFARSVPSSNKAKSAASARSAVPEGANLGSTNTTNVNLLMHDLEVTGTKRVGSYPPNRYGLHDMIGNVWEWSNDYFDPLPTPVSSYHPAGAPRGLARVIRGGSFISTTSTWARGYRSCEQAEYTSRFTGFRVCRTVEAGAAAAPAPQKPKWFEPYNHPPPGYESSIGNLSPLVSPGMSLPEWEARRETIKAKWLKLLGSMEIKPPAPKARFVEAVVDQNFAGKLMYLQVEPDWWEKILIMMPSATLTRPCPVVIVPFYDVDDPVGRDLSGRVFDKIRVDAFARMAVEKGYIAVAMRWFGESYGEGLNEAVANLKLRHPHCTGLGKWVWDSERLVDYLFTLPDVDQRRIGIIGHSLGGKMALYAPAFDRRITAVVSNELGIGLKFSNYEDYWYFGEFIQKVDHGTDQHELIGLIAPRPFLLIGGDKFDTAKSWYYINAARQVYELYGKRLNIGYYNHHKGHRPTPEADWLSMEWLVHFLGRAPE